MMDRIFLIQMNTEKEWGKRGAGSLFLLEKSPIFIQSFAKNRGSNIFGFRGNTNERNKQHRFLSFIMDLNGFLC